MPSHDPDRRALIARMASHASWANTTDPAARTAPARAEFDERFLRQVDPDGSLPIEERTRRAAHARKAYFLGLAAKSADARRRKAEAAELRRLADEIDGAA